MGGRAGGLTALFAGFLRLDTFADRFGEDSFVSPAPALATRCDGTLRWGSLSSISVSQTWISKNGAFVAFMRGTTRRGFDDPGRKAGGPFAEIDASDAMFWTTPACWC
jgi:hypothetical protein